MAMFKCYLITYDLKKKEIDDYKKLYEEIQRSPKWWHFLDSTWIIATSETPGEVWLRIENTIHKEDDRLMIIEIRPNMQGWLPKEAWDWIAENAN